MTARGRLRDDVVLSIVGRVVAIGFAFALQVIVSRALGRDGRGEVYTAFNITLVLLQVATVGVPAANVFFGARNRASAGALAANSVALAAVLGPCAIVGVLLVRLAVPALWSDLGTALFLAAILPLPFVLIATFLQQLLLSLGRVTAFAAIDAIQPAVAIASLAVAYRISSPGPAATLGMIGGGFLLSAAYAISATRHAAPGPWVVDRQLARSMMSYSARAYIASLMMFLLLRIDLQMVFNIQGKGAAGLYSVATGIADGLVLLPVLVGMNLLPRVVESTAWEETASVFRSVGLLFAVLCAVSALAAPLIPFVYGKDFAASVTIYLCLIPGIYALGMASILANYFGGRGLPIGAVLAWLPGLAVNVTLNLLLLPGNGTWVASINASVGYGIVLLVLMALFVRDAGSLRALVPRVSETLRFVRVILGKS